MCDEGCKYNEEKGRSGTPGHDSNGNFACVAKLVHHLLDVYLEGGI